MKWLLTCYACCILSGCITDYMAKDINEESNILVVEGAITEGETEIKLSRSLNLTDINPAISIFVDDARVYVECDDGTRIEAEESDPAEGARNGRYLIPTGKLEMERKYRLKIEIDEPDAKSDDCIVQAGGVVQCPVKTFEYCTDYAFPIVTPAIDSVFWSKKSAGQPVIIHVATHDPDNKTLFYRWSYEEDWEIHTDIMSVFYFYPEQCWSSSRNSDLLLGSSEQTVLGRLTDIITEISPTDRKLEVLYRIIVKQNVISKAAYDYYTNIKTNDEQMGSIFAQMPSELRGNIICTTEPGRPVIGYVDVSLTKQQHLFIPRSAGVYEYTDRNWLCEPVLQDSLLEAYEGYLPSTYRPYLWTYDTIIKEYVLYYTLSTCIDCSSLGELQMPDDWPE